MSDDNQPPREEDRNAVTLTLIINGTEIDWSEYNDKTDFVDEEVEVEIECDATPNEDLRELLEVWKERKESAWEAPTEASYRECIRELQEVIE